MKKKIFPAYKIAKILLKIKIINIPQLNLMFHCIGKNCKGSSSYIVAFISSNYYNIVENMVGHDKKIIFLAKLQLKNKNYIY